MEPEKIKVIQGWPPPTTVPEVRQFIGLCGFFQQFVEGFQAVAAPLPAMFKADLEWEWTAVHQAPFDKLKQAMINATHLSAIDPRELYHLYTDASKDCVGATLAQRCAHGKYKGHLRPIAFMSRKMPPAETRYPIPEEGPLAIVLALKQWFHLLRGPQQVLVHNDHESLRYFKTCPRSLTPGQARWFQFLEEYNLTLWYVPGLENPAAYACSRLTSRQLMHIENATRTRAFVIPLVKNWASPEGEPVDEFLHVLEDSVSHDEVWPQPYDDLYFCFEADAPSGRNLMLTKMRNQPSNSTPNQPSGRRTRSNYRQTRQPSSQRTRSHCHQTRFWLRIHTNQKYISMMLATSQTCLPTLTTFPT